MGRFLERYLFGDDRDFCWIVKKLKKVQNFSSTLDFFWKILIRGQKKGSTIFPMPGRKKMGKMEKNQTTFGFSSKILVWSDPMATLTTMLNEQKGKGMNNTS